MTNAADNAARFQRNYLIGAGSVVGACMLLALASEKPSRGLAVVGAATMAGGIYAAAVWPSTKRVIADYAAAQVEEQIRAIGAQVFK